MNSGIVCALTAFIIWGLYPLYWKQLDSIPALQLALHRIVWSFVILAFIMSILRQWTTFYQSLTYRIVSIYTVSTCCIFTNWYILVWAINAGYILETSLGNFINPLINVVFGVVIFKEVLRKLQWLSVALAASGVLVVAIAYAKFPWIALTGAITLAIYGLVKKVAPLSPLHGLFLETAILFPPSFIYLLVLQIEGTGAFLHVDALKNTLIIGGGVVTIVPLLLFSAAAQSVPLSVIGIIAYVSPSVRFAIGALVYHETLTSFQLCGFILVWVALVVFTLESYAISRQKQPQLMDDIEATYIVIMTPLIETSLGMFITPLMNVMLGVVIFKEKLSKWQWISIFIVCCGVTVCAVAYGRFPWIAITTAVTFGFYSLIKKKAPLVPLHGMMLETLILLPAALIYLIVVECKGTGSFLHTTVGTNLLLVGGGPVTILPLLIFSAAAQLIALSLLGILQYIQPTLQFLIGVLVYHEPLSMVKLVGFILVWLKESNTDIVLTPRESNANAQYIEEI
ncbi:hypothetical protein THRCLA_00087 [Thraustotheca clavata]|uniref:EamA domain-containing protein n=1 Tax=Thraustotheca clavata TaxID=74557 RepID=A0A1W0AC88_9STRA|nr:hypothetical protein THRCLA_00087 [Thraustotheca clavata]